MALPALAPRPAFSGGGENIAFLLGWRVNQSTVRTFHYKTPSSLFPGKLKGNRTRHINPAAGD